MVRLALVSSFKNVSGTRNYAALELSTVGKRFDWAKIRQKNRVLKMFIFPDLVLKIECNQIDLSI